MRHYQENVLTSPKAYYILADISVNGSSYAKEIAVSNDMHRPTVSEILNSMKEKGILSVHESKKKPGKHFQIDHDGLIEISLELWSEEFDIELDSYQFKEFIEKRYDQIEELLEESFEKLTNPINMEVPEDDPLKKNTLGAVRSKKPSNTSYEVITPRLYFITYVEAHLNKSLIHDRESTIEEMLNGDFRKQIKESEEALNRLPDSLKRLKETLEDKSDIELDYFEEEGVKILADLLETEVNTLKVEDIGLSLKPELLYIERKYSGITKDYLANKEHKNKYKGDKGLKHPFVLNCLKCDEKLSFEEKEGLDVICKCECREIRVPYSPRMTYLLQN